MGRCLPRGDGLSTQVNTVVFTSGYRKLGGEEVIELVEIWCQARHWAVCHEATRALAMDGICVDAERRLRKV